MKRALVLLAICAAAVTVAGQAPQPSKAKEPQRVQLYPKFHPGQILYYQMDFRNRTSGNSEGLIVNPEGSKERDVSVSALVRVDVLSAAPSPSLEAPPSVHLRTTYEKVASTIRVDVPDPQADQLQSQIQQLEKKSLEFTIGADGKVSEIHGLEDIFPEQQAGLREWLTGTGFTVSLPHEGIYPGMKWSAELLKNAAVPLTGVTWKNESTYLRDEPCHAVKLTPEGTAVQVRNPEPCAVILSVMSLDEISKHADRTPPEFRARNLRTSGVMSGKGQSLSYISLESGLVVSVTQTSQQDIDVTISQTNGESGIHYKGTVETQSQLSLVTDHTDPPTDPPK